MAARRHGERFAVRRRQRLAGGQCRRRHLGQGGADILNWVMGFETGEDRLKVSGMTEAFRAPPRRGSASTCTGRYPIEGSDSTSPGRRSARSTCLRS